MTEVNRILILENNPEDQAIYKRYLSSSFSPNLEMIFTEKGGEALAYLSNHTVDCVLLDFELPDMTGLDFLRKLVASDMTYPVVMLTGHGSEKIAVKALKMGSCDYIVKEDLDPQLLYNSILYAIEKSALDKKSKEGATKIQYVAYHDGLTSIPNRLYFEMTFTKMLSAAKRYHKPLILMMLDLDGFKGVNDTFGHAAGDDLLKQVTKRLQSALRDEDLLARLGGDEFVILIRDIQQTEDVRIVAQKIMSALQEPFYVSGNTVSITPSIGIVTYPHSGETIPDLLRNVDKIMYQAKNKGGNRFEMDGQ